MNSTLDIRQFTRTALEDLGCLVEPAGSTGLDALLTPEVARVTRLPEVARLAFDTSEEGHLLQPGMEAMDGLLELCTQGLSVCHRTVAMPERAGRARALAVLQERMAFPNSRPAWGDETWGTSVYLECGFVASLVSDERRELVDRVILDLTRGCVVAAGPAGESTMSLEPLDVSAIERGLLVAAEAARKRLAVRIEKWLRRCADREAVDQSRAREYFETLRSEVKRRIRSALMRGQDVAGLEAKLATLDVEAVKRQRDLADKHQVRSTLSLGVLDVVQAPRASVSVQLANRYTTASVKVWYNPFTRDVDGPPCGNCQTPTTALYLCLEGHVVCAGCARPCTTCRRVRCAACGMGTCPRCGKLWCDTCQRVKPACARCGAAQCENCATVGSCHAVPKVSVSAPPEKTIPRLSGIGVVFNPSVKNWRIWVPEEPLVRATTSDARGDMAAVFTLRKGGEVVTVGVRWNIFSLEVEKAEVRVMRQTERRMLQNQVLPAGLTWYDLRWPFPIVLADLLSKAAPEAFSAFRRTKADWPQISPLVPLGADQALWDLEPMKQWGLSMPPGTQVQWERLLRDMAARQYHVSLKRRLYVLLLTWAHLPQPHPREADLLAVYQAVNGLGMQAPALQALLRRTAGLVADAG